MSPAASPRVFISYTRKDGEAFATELRRRLEIEEPEIPLWQDRAQLEGGIGWWRQIEDALDRVKFLVVVMTPAAMASEITRREWRYARQKGVVVYPVKGADDSALDYASLPNWMRKAHFFDLEKEWITFTNYLKSDRQPVRVPFMAPQMPKVFVPRPHEFDLLLRLILDRTQQNPVAITTSLQGAGGYGKTTLATALCHADRVLDAFDDGILWVTLGQTPNVVNELGKVYEALTGEHGGFVDIEQGARKLAEKLEHRNCLLVVDDVWDRAHAAPFLRGGDTCTRLITTRRLDIDSQAARVPVDEMTPAESVAVLASAFDAETAPTNLLHPLARRLGEWPLLLRLAAGMLRKRLARRDTPEGAVAYVAKTLDKHGVTAFDSEQSLERDKAVTLTVAASRDLLSPQDRRRLAELAIFPEEASVPLTTVGRLWGLDDLDTEECAHRLDDVALVTLDLREATLSLHDVMRAFLIRELDDPARLHATLIEGYRDLMHLPDAYAWRWLPYHLAKAGQVERLRALLLDPAWLMAQLAATEVNALVQSFDEANTDPDLSSIQRTVRRSMHVLASAPDQLAEQLYGRIGLEGSKTLDRFSRDVTRLGPRPRLHGRWPNLGGTGSSLVQVLTGHEDVIVGAQVLPDGRVLSWSGDRTLRVWDIAAGSAQVLTGHASAVNGALALPDERVLSWSGDRTLRIWDIAAGSAQILTGHESGVRGAQVLLDRRILSWSTDNTLRVWDIAAGNEQTLAGHESAVTGCHVLADGRILSWSSDHTLRVWDIETRTSQVLTGHDGAVIGAQLLPGDRILSWSADHTVRIWDIVTGIAQVLSGHEGLVTGAQSLRDGRILSWSADHTVRVWNIVTRSAQVLTGHDGSVTGAQLLGNGCILSWSADRSLRIWDVATRSAQILTGHENGVAGAQVLPDGRVLSWSGDRTLRVWDIASWSARVLTGHESAVRGAQVLPDGRVLSWSADHTLRVWDIAAASAQVLTGHDTGVIGAGVTGARLLLDGRVLTWSGDHTLRAWDTATGRAQVLTGHRGWVRGAQVLPDGRVLSWSGDRTLRVWDITTGRSLVLTGHDSSVRGADVLPDGRVLSWSGDRTLRVWDIGTNTVQILLGHESAANGAHVLPDGRILSWSGDRTLRVWEIATGRAQVLIGHETGVRGAQVMPDGRVLSWSGDRTLRVWDIATERSEVLTGHESGVRGALVLRDNRVLSWGGDRTLRVWDLATGGIRVLNGHENAVAGAHVLPDDRVLSWSEDYTLRLWGEGDSVQVLTGHQGWVAGAEVLKDGHALSWSRDRTFRVWNLKKPAQLARFDFDATPTAVVVCPDGYFVGDALGRVHFLEWFT